MVFLDLMSGHREFLNEREMDELSRKLAHPMFNLRFNVMIRSYGSPAKY